MPASQPASQPASRRAPVGACPDLSGSSDFPPPVRGGSPSDTVRARAGHSDTAAPRAGRRLGRAFGLLALAACCVLLAPVAALAQAVHVTNLGQSDDADLDPNYIANSFITGGTTTDRFTLTSVVIDFTNGSGDPTWVRIYNNSSGSPGTQIGSNLVKQGSGTTGNITYNAPSGGIAFNGGTRYYVVVNTAAATAVLDGTSSNDEDNSSTSGWTIGQFAHRSSNANNWTGDPNSYAMRFRVNANVVVSLSADKVTQTGARLTIAGHAAAWYYKSTQSGATCSSQVAMGTTQVTLSSLTANTAYTYKAYSNSTCSTELTTNASDAEFTTLDLTATNIGQTTARVSIVNHTGGWHLRRTAPSTGTCVPLSGSQHFQNLINLTANTSYTYRAYLLANCPTSSELASVTFMTLAPSDTTPPSVVTGGYSPADNATGVATNANLVLTFNEAVQKGTGNIVIRTGTNTDVTIDVTSNQVSVGGTGNTVVTINPTNDLGGNTAYRVRIASGAIKDSANNNYAGINDDTTWNFETAAAPDTTPPQLASNPFSPADNATGVARNANLRVTFNENVQRDTAKYIRLWAAGQANPTPITVSISGATVTLDPDSDLDANTDHSVWIEAGAIEDLAGNEFAGFENPTIWNFTTGTTTVTPVIPPTVGGGGGAPRPNLVPAFGEMTPISLTLIQHETPAPRVLPAATSGDGPLTYTLTPALPDGLTFDPATRTLRGTPTAAQAATRYTYTVTDADGDTATLSFTLTIAADTTPTFGAATVPALTGVVNVALEPVGLPAAAGGNGPLTYTLTPALPDGLTFDPATRTLRGTPTATQAATRYTYTATDADGDTATRPVTLTIGLVSTAGQQTIKATLAELGRALVGEATEMLGQRGDAAPAGPAVTLAGQRVNGWAGLAQAMAAGAPAAGNGRRGPVAQSPGLTLAGVLHNSAFTLPLADEAGGRAWTVWGRGHRRQFAGQADEGAWDSALWTGWLGVDTRLPNRVLAGAAVSHSRADADYRRGREGGALDTTLTAVWPYVQLDTETGGAVRLLAGAGRGEVRQRTRTGATAQSNLNLLAGALSGRWPLIQRGPLTLAAVGDANVARLTADGPMGTGLDALTAATWRLRGGVETRHAGLGLFGSAWTLTPRGTLAARQDGGAGVTGTGLELAGGVRLTKPASRFGLAASGHWLAVHSATGRREWGASVDAHLRPRADGLGLALTLGSQLGRPPQAGTLTQDDVFTRAGLGDPDALALTAQAGYGLAALAGVLTPATGLALTDRGLTQARVGVTWQWAGVRTPLGAWHVGLTGQHRNAAGGPPEQRVGVQLHLQFGQGGPGRSLQATP